MWIQFYKPTEVNSEAWDKLVEMDYVPHVGESVNFGRDPDDSEEFNITHVTHCPDGTVFQAYCIVRT